MVPETQDCLHAGGADLLPVALKGSGVCGEKSLRISGARAGGRQQRQSPHWSGEYFGNRPRWPPGLSAPVLHPMGLQVDCKKANPVKGRGSTLVSQLPACLIVAYPLLFRETLLNNEQVRTAGAILEHSDAVTL